MHEWSILFWVFFCLGAFLFPFACLFFQCLVGKIGSSFPCLFQREVLVLSLFCFIRKCCWMIFFLFCAWLFEILDLTFIKKKYMFSTLRALELVLFGNVSEIIFPLSFMHIFQAWKDRKHFWFIYVKTFSNLSDKLETCSGVIKCRRCRYFVCTTS